MILDRLFAASPENPKYSLSSPGFWDDVFDGAASSTGERLNREKALTYAPWWRGINLISNSVGKLPLFTYRNTPTGKVFDRQHNAWKLLRRKPNDQMTAFDFKKTLVAHALQEGNGYAYIRRLGDGAPDELLLLDPTKTTPAREDGRLLYVTHIGVEARKLAAEDVLHVHGLSFDGLTGYSVYDKARESLGLGLAARKFGSVFFKNNARPNIAIEVPGKLDEPAQKALRDSWERIQGGLDNSHRIALLMGGAKLQTFSIEAKNAQLLETRKFEAREVALWLGVPPHKLGDSEKANYNSLEQENQDYLDEGLDPWLIAIEEECWEKLLSEEEKERESHEIEFYRKALLRADSTARANYFRVAGGGRPWMTPDEIRRDEDLEERGGDAASLKDPLNMGTPPEPEPDSPKPPPSRKEQKPPPPDDDDAEQAFALPAAARLVVEDAAVRCLRRLGHAADAAGKKPAGFLVWLDAFASDHGEALREILTPAAALVDADAGELARTLIAQVHADLLDLSGACTPAELAAGIRGRMAQLERRLPADLTAEYLPIGRTDARRPGRNVPVVNVTIQAPPAPTVTAPITVHIPAQPVVIQAGRTGPITRLVEAALPGPLPKQE